MRIDRPPVQDRHLGRPPDEIDRLLRAYMRAELPDPWPTLRAPAPPRTLRVSAERRWPVLNSRLALAATVAFCLVGSLSVASMFSTETPAGKIPPGTNAGPVEVIRGRNGEKLEIRVEEKGNTIKIEVRKKPVEQPEIDLEPMPPED